MRIVIQARFKNGYLHEAVKRRGWTYGQAAEFIGIGYHTFLKWVGLRKIPAAKYHAKIEELTGLPVEVVFPPELDDPEFHSLPKVIERAAEVGPMALQRFAPKLIESPVEVASKNEMIAIINEVAKARLTEREAKIFKRRMDGAKIKDIAREFNVTKSRVDQLNRRAINKIRLGLECRGITEFEI